MCPLNLIVAMSASGAIGQGGKLPWHAPEDLRRFRRLTMGHAIIMGRRTYESIGHCLPGRTNIVLSSKAWSMPALAMPPLKMSEPPTRAMVAGSLEEAMRLALLVDPSPFIIGGASVYAEALPLVTKIHRTVIAGDFPEADAFMPKGWHDGFDLVDASTGDGPVAQYQTLVREQRRMA